MSDSSDNDELFADSNDEKADDEIQGDAPPSYISGDEFLQFKEKNQIQVDPKYGYVAIHTYKPFYFPGEIVRGSIILDFFNTLPKSNKKI